MKKIIRFFGILSVLAVLLALTGCGSKGFDGKWEAYHIDFAPNKYNVSIDPYISAYGNYHGVLGDIANIEIKDGSVVRYTSDSREYTQFRSVTVDGDKMTFDFHDSLFGYDSFWYSAEVTMNSSDDITVIDGKWLYRMKRLSWAKANKLLIRQTSFIAAALAVALVLFLRLRKLSRSHRDGDIPEGDTDE